MDYEVSDKIRHILGKTKVILDLSLPLQVEALIRVILKVKFNIFLPREVYLIAFWFKGVIL